MSYWMKRSSGGSEPLHGLGNMSKTDILRGLITERLSTAARDILAVVERTVADYEEEAAGFRQEIGRQRRQLELLLQPQVKLERRAVVPDLDSQEVVVLSEDEVEQQVQVQQPGVEDTGSMGLLWFDDDDDEEEQPKVQPGTSSRQKRDDLKDPGFQTSSRSLSPRVRSVRKKPGRLRISDAQNHLDLRICILEDSQTNVLSKTVFQRYPLHDLRCPRGLQEDHFLLLLRSTFPQLAAGEPFDVFTSDRSRRLQPLKVKGLTPEEICGAIRATGAGNSALYVRLKRAEGPNSQDLQKQGDDDGSSSPTTPANQSEVCPRDQSDGRRRGRPRLGEEPTHHCLRICMLEDSRTDVLSKSVLLKSSIQDLKCPRGLQEADFLDQLRSAFPQLAADDKPLDIFKSDRSRRLQRLDVKTLTPEEIYRSMKSIGGQRTALYIRLKTGEQEVQEEQEEQEEQLCLSQTNDDSQSSDAVVVKSDEAVLRSRRHVHHADGGRAGMLSSSSASPQQQPDLETEEDAASSIVKSGDDGAGDEALDVDDDWKPDPKLRPPKTRRKREPRNGVERMESSKTACKVCGVWYRILGGLIKHAWSHVDEPQGVCAVCGERFQSVEELKGHLRNYQKTHDCSYCGKSFLTATGLKCHTSLHTGNRPFKCSVCSKTFAHLSGLNIHRWVHVADKPHKCDVCPRSFGLKAQLRAHSKVHSGRDKYHCNICGKSVYDLRSLTRHKLTHSGERRYGCEVCGKRFKLPDTLKSHEKIHTVRDRPYLCDICCKTFLSNCSLTTHMRTHSNEKPFVCSKCSKGFVSNGELKAHMQVHTGEAPYGCSECSRFFKRKTHLNNHVKSHLGIRLFVCSVCGKACFRQEHLTVHMRTHNGERPYKCTVCEKAFTQSHCLKTHMKSHQGEDGAFGPSAS